ncbi:MAG TPA: ComEC/Rec2 family competence protein [Candidatus Portnoybacteria bacterium]|nr:ComEC/Rec2 family competence protein [Candidatus Portnoybacteria bacterium]MDD5751963.1 ComEC/Rec2 family competence protein [Candidatus Portnoybacteria bacterium]HOZ16233.1 ComEC/Rec2 family competence protein [Candidatus Portnoybacteria bacterium]HPH51972.1 ComEC/Rec2 family competence protein [Candidatus Portnoybacteria bacterium]HPJ80127.1 ComEC/Rec2 family competence protein [Candidatus Portnoybacteria bacterium]
MKTSNIFLIICLIFIITVFFVSPKILEKRTLSMAGQAPLSEKNMELFGKIIKEPIIKSSSMQITINTDTGKILITAPNYPKYNYGDVLKIEGKLQFPIVFEDFNYKQYLAKDKIYYVMYYPKIELIDENQGNKIFSAILKFKNKITDKIETIMPFPEASILEGIILGNKQIFSEEIKNNLSITGTSHIAAISGMNIVIISNIVMIFLIGLGFWRKQAFWITVMLIIAFIFMVGAPASAVRAGIMGIILLYAKKIGRLGNITRIMVFAGAIMLIFNPLLLRYDIGFQLSFLAVLGLIYIKPIFDRILEKILKKEQINNFLQIITTTISAQIAVLGVLIYNFGRISFISPIVNVLIVPFITLLTIIGIIFIGGAMISIWIGKILLWPAYLGTTYVLRIIDWFAKIPWASKQISNVHWLWAIGYYILLVGIIGLYSRYQNRNKYLVLEGPNIMS